MGLFFNVMLRKRDLKRRGSGWDLSLKRLQFKANLHLEGAKAAREPFSTLRLFHADPGVGLLRTPHINILN